MRAMFACEATNTAAEPRSRRSSESHAHDATHRAAPPGESFGVGIRAATRQPPTSDHARMSATLATADRPRLCPEISSRIDQFVP